MAGAGDIVKAVKWELVCNKLSPNLTAVNNKYITPQFWPVRNLGAA